MIGAEKRFEESEWSVETAADEDLLTFLASSPAAAALLTRLAINDPKLATMFRLLWRQGYVHGVAATARTETNAIPGHHRNGDEPHE